MNSCTHLIWEKKLVQNVNWVKKLEPLGIVPCGHKMAPGTNEKYDSMLIGT